MTRAPYTPSARQIASRAEDKRFGRRRTDAPVPGLYAWRFRKGAPEVAAEIVYGPTPDPDFPDNIMDRTPLWSVRISGQPDLDPSPMPSETTWSVYIFGRRIDRAEFDYLLADREWAAEHAPESPEANPKKPVDHLKIPPPF